MSIEELRALAENARCATCDGDPTALTHDTKHNAFKAREIAACPTPSYHETHRYCPSCPWLYEGTGAYDLHAYVRPAFARAVLAALDEIEKPCEMGLLKTGRSDLERVLNAMLAAATESGESK